MDIAAYIAETKRILASGQATEHSYRPVLLKLFQAIDQTLTVINEPKRLRDVGAPDFRFSRGDIAIGWCEAKDIGVDILKPQGYGAEQKARYKKGLPNLLYTNGFEFEFIRDGVPIATIRLIDLTPDYPANADKIPELEHFLRDFASQSPTSITTAKELAEMMAGKTVLIKDTIFNALEQDKKANIASALMAQYEGFRQTLIHEVSFTEFADVYAETIAYGLFGAQLHNNNPAHFTRAAALELLPKSNPFLRSLFGYIAGVDLDERITWPIDQLCNIFRASDFATIMENFGKLTARDDPFLHFYETFLAAYNPAKRKARGVWYTPEPVVNFIVRAVDDVLKTEFDLPEGLADTSKITIDWDETTANGKTTSTKRDVHRVQILDPATGTGTFLAEVIKQIAERVKAVAPGQWANYVAHDLIPRLHGFELLMASYAMCHMKLDMVLGELGYQNPGNQRLSVYLTNTLEEGARVSQNLFAQWLANEAKGANDIKRQMPIMCVIGNPPYAGESVNKSDWIMGLMEAYKKEPESAGKLQERNPKWINDDYVKFIRFAEHMIVKNGAGILGFITNHGYLDNPTFRGMRWHLLGSFDKIHVLDLHGNAKKKEVAPDGTADKNVFDIQQGVAIIIAVKKAVKAGQTKPLAEVFHSELWGSREGKGKALYAGKLGKTIATKLAPKAPHYPFVERNHDVEGVYQQGFSVNSLFNVGVMGFQTHRDHFAIGWSPSEIYQSCKDLLNFIITDEKIFEEYNISNNRDWKLQNARKIIKSDNDWENKITRCAYRPLDNRSCYLSEVMMDYPRNELIQHGLNKENLFLGVGRQGLAVGQIEWCLAIVSNYVMDANIFRRGGVNVMPLYLYPDEAALDTTRRINFEPKLYQKICALAGLDPNPSSALTPNPSSALTPNPSPVKGEGSRAHQARGEGSLLPLREKVPEGRMRGVREETLRTRAKDMRHAPTPAEKKLWQLLRNRRLADYKFRRQMPIGNYIVDFVCLERWLIVEADGSQHDESAYDAVRDRWLESQGFRIKRFWNGDIVLRESEVVETLWHVLQKTPPSSGASRHLLPQGEKGLPSSLAEEGLGVRADEGERPPELKVFDYIYGVLHSPAYRETFAAFLKIDFPRIPFPQSPENFATISAWGERLRRLHLMEPQAIGETPYPLQGDGDSVVDKPHFTEGKIYINKTQYFANIPPIAWEFHIGGYQPAQKWLKDRKGRALSYEDVRHYQRIIKILSETDRIMREIDLPLDGIGE